MAVSEHSYYELEVTQLGSKDVLTKIEQLDQAFKKSVKQQQLKGKNSIGVQMDPNPSSLPGLKITGSFKYFPKPTYDEHKIHGRHVIKASL